MRLGVWLRALAVITALVRCCSRSRASLPSFGIIAAARAAKWRSAMVEVYDINAEARRAQPVTRGRRRQAFGHGRPRGKHGDGGP